MKRKNIEYEPSYLTQHTYLNNLIIADLTGLTLKTDVYPATSTASVSQIGNI